VKKTDDNSGADLSKRRLIYVPILHTRADMGGLGETARRIAVRKSGGQAWKRKTSLIDQLWKEIGQKMDGLALSCERTRLYQDGLPICEREKEIVGELAGMGSRNHQILLRLMERGATLMGTESAELLVEEYQFVQQLLSASRPMQKPGLEARQKTWSRSLLEKRDAFIANRINGTLCAGETGILFLGMLHSLEGRLDPEIEVSYLGGVSPYKEEHVDVKKRRPYSDRG
jgi:hypothetical protein